MRNWEQTGDDQQELEEAEAVITSRNLMRKRKPISQQEINYAATEEYAKPGTTSLSHAAEVSQTKSWDSRNYNWEKTKCYFEGEMLADDSTPRITISRLTKK